MVTEVININLLAVIVILIAIAAATIYFWNSSRKDRSTRQTFQGSITSGSVSDPMRGWSSPAVSAASKKLFLSYRREDSADVAGRIYDRLSQAFEKDQVFKDVDAIPLGVDFRMHLQKTLESCDVLLVVVGDRWLTPAGTAGVRRIDDPKDFVRIELEVALQRDIPVIPLLVRGAAVPQEDELPAVLASLAYRNGTSIRPDPDFHRDMDRLIQTLQTYLTGEGSRT
jgi:hypothetical protein